MNNMLQISEASSLAIHAMAYMTENSERPCATRDIAAAVDGSANHLSKVMQRLVKAGIVNSVRGPNGGFTLAKDANSTTLLNVYEAIEGPFRQTDCLLTKKVCQGNKCVFGDVLAKTNSMVYEHLSKTRLSDLGDVLQT